MKRAAVLAQAVLCLGCGEGTAPPRPSDAVDVTIEFCPSTAPMWVAYKNEGREWVRPPHAPFQASFTFPATPRLTLATGRASASGSVLVDVWNVTAPEMQDFRCVPSPTEADMVQMSGTFKTLHEQDMVVAASSVDVSGGRTSLAYTLRVEAPGLFDLVAELVPATSERPGLTIIHRAVPVVNGGALPVLDFTAPEAAPFDSARVSATGLRAGAEIRASVHFQTANGTVRDLFSVGEQSRTGVLRVRSFPSPPQSGDLHEIELLSFAGLGAQSVRYTTDALKDTTVAFGPEMAAATIALVDSSPFQRFNVRLPRQPEYGSLASASYHQHREGEHLLVTVTATAAYAGAANDWNLDLPDFTKAPDFPMRWALHPPYPGGIEIVASDEPLGSRLGTGPRAPTLRRVRHFADW